MHVGHLFAASAVLAATLLFAAAATAQSREWQPPRTPDYNDFWYERGSQPTEDKRTPLIVDPSDGRIPFAPRSGGGRSGRRYDDPKTVPLDGRPLGALPRWIADSRGRREGDTLVIETLNFKRETSLPGSSVQTRKEAAK